MASVDQVTTATKDRLQLSPPWIPIKPRHRARNITEQFNKACEALVTGQLVKDESFSLFDSVPALEIMDPKMDTGFLQPGETLEETYDVTRDILPEEVIWIMDELLCYEIAWHHGYPMAQNLLTSVYMYNLLIQERLPNTAPFFRSLDGSRSEPGPLVQKVLRAFCIGIIKTCDIAIEMVTSQHFFEEEDFNTHTFALDLLTDIPDRIFFDLHTAAEEWIVEQEIAGDISRPIRDALIIRLACREKFLGLIIPSKDQEEAATDAESFLMMLKKLDGSRSGIKKPLEASFSAKLQRKLASTVPPRPIIKIPFDQTITDFGRLFSDIQEALTVQFFGDSTTLQNIAGFLWAFSSRDPLPLARAVVQIFLFNEDKIVGPGDSIKKLLLREMGNMLISQACLQQSFWDVEMPTDPRYQVVQAVELFLAEAPSEFTNVLRSLCQNRCRLRRCLTNVIRDVDTLQMDLSRHFGKDPTLDSNCSFPSLIKHMLLNMVRSLKSDISTWIIQIGFEQSIYQPFEIAYLQNYIALTMKQKRQHHEHFTKHMLQCRQEIQRVTGSKIVCDQPNFDEHKDESMWEGLSLLHVALFRLGAIEPSKTPYCTSRSQVELRMAPFLQLHGVVPIDTTNFGIPAASSKPLHEILHQSGGRLGSARQHLAKLRKAASRDGFGRELAVSGHTQSYLLETIVAALKACVRAGVAVDMLQRALNGVGGNEEKLHGGVEATFDTPVLGAYWVVPQVVIRKA